MKHMVRTLLLVVPTTAALLGLLGLFRAAGSVLVGGGLFLGGITGFGLARLWQANRRGSAPHATTRRAAARRENASLVESPRATSAEPIGSALSQREDVQPARHTATLQPAPQTAGLEPVPEPATLQPVPQTAGLQPVPQTTAPREELPGQAPTKQGVAASSAEPTVSVPLPEVIALETATALFVHSAVRNVSEEMATEAVGDGRDDDFSAHELAFFAEGEALALKEGESWAFRLP